jgi:hypothetical protein
MTYSLVPVNLQRIQRNPLIVQNVSNYKHKLHPLIFRKLQTIYSKYLKNNNKIYRDYGVGITIYQ